MEGRSSHRALEKEVFSGGSQTAERTQKENRGLPWALRLAFR